LDRSDVRDIYTALSPGCRSDRDCFSLNKFIWIICCGSARDCRDRGPFVRWARSLLAESPGRFMFKCRFWEGDPSAACPIREKSGSACEGGFRSPVLGNGYRRTAAHPRRRDPQGPGGILKEISPASLKKQKFFPLAIDGSVGRKQEPEQYS